MVVYLGCSTDNKAATVFTLFMDGVTEFGLPSRVRSDKGGENVDVAWFMGVPGGGAGGAPAPPICWANKASRAIFALQSGNIGLI